MGGQAALEAVGGGGIEPETHPPFLVSELLREPVPLVLGPDTEPLPGPGLRGSPRAARRAAHSLEVDETGMVPGAG